MHRTEIPQRDYSRTSRKRPTKMSSLGGRLREVVAYEKLDNIGSKFCLISIMVTAETYPMRLFPSKHMQSRFRLKNQTLPTCSY